MGRDSLLNPRGPSAKPLPESPQMPAATDVVRAVRFSTLMQLLPESDRNTSPWALAAGSGRGRDCQKGGSISRLDVLGRSGRAGISVRSDSMSATRRTLAGGCGRSAKSLRK